MCLGGYLASRGRVRNGKSCKERRVVAVTTAKMNPDAAAEALLREVWGVDRASDVPLPVSPVMVAQHLGVEVYNAGFKRPDVSGMLMKRAGEDAKIYLNRGHHDNRKRFTCAHEIGHYVKHAKHDSDNWAYVEHRDSLSATGSDQNEREANAFAAALLMPADRVRREWKKTPSHAALAVRFGVSVEAMGHRLRNLGIC